MRIYTIRTATVRDVPAMAQLINLFAGRGLMLFRPHGELYEKLREFLVACDPAQPEVLLGLCALDIVWGDLAEVRSLAVAPPYHGQGIGRALVQAVESEARRLEIQKLFALTYEQAFFQRLGFEIVARETLPQKVWSDCVRCAKRECCDEIAMVKTLFATPLLPASLETMESYEVPAPLIQLALPKG